MTNHYILNLLQCTYSLQGSEELPQVISRDFNSIKRLRGRLPPAFRTFAGSQGLHVARIRGGVASEGFLTPVSYLSRSSSPVSQAASDSAVVGVSSKDTSFFSELSLLKKPFLKSHESKVKSVPVDSKLKQEKYVLGQEIHCFGQNDEDDLSVLLNDYDDAGDTVNCRQSTHSQIQPSTAKLNSACLEDIIAMDGFEDTYTDDVRACGDSAHSQPVDKESVHCAGDGGSNGYTSEALPDHGMAKQVEGQAGDFIAKSSLSDAHKGVQVLKENDQALDSFMEQTTSTSVTQEYILTDSHTVHLSEELVIKPTISNSVVAEGGPRELSPVSSESSSPQEHSFGSFCPEKTDICLASIDKVTEEYPIVCITAVKSDKSSSVGTAVLESGTCLSEERGDLSHTDLGVNAPNTGRQTYATDEMSSLINYKDGGNKSASSHENFDENDHYLKSSSTQAETLVMACDAMYETVGESGSSVSQKSCVPLRGTFLDMTCTETETNKPRDETNASSIVSHTSGFAFCSAEEDRQNVCGETEKQHEQQQSSIPACDNDTLSAVAKVQESIQDQQTVFQSITSEIMADHSATELQTSGIMEENEVHCQHFADSIDKKCIAQSQVSTAMKENIDLQTVDVITQECVAQPQSGDSVIKENMAQSISSGDGVDEVVVMSQATVEDNLLLTQKLDTDSGNFSSVEKTEPVLQGIGSVHQQVTESEAEQQLVEEIIDEETSAVVYQSEQFCENVPEEEQQMNPVQQAEHGVVQEEIFVTSLPQESLPEGTNKKDAKSRHVSTGVLEGESGDLEHFTVSTDGQSNESESGQEICIDNSDYYDQVSTTYEQGFEREVSQGTPAHEGGIAFLERGEEVAASPDEAGTGSSGTAPLPQADVLAVASEMAGVGEYQQGTETMEVNMQEQETCSNDSENADGQGDMDIEEFVPVAIETRRIAAVDTDRETEGVTTEIQHLAVKEEDESAHQQILQPSGLRSLLPQHLTQLPTAASSTYLMPHASAQQQQQQTEVVVPQEHGIEQEASLEQQRAAALGEVALERVFQDAAVRGTGMQVVNLYVQWQNVDALCWLDVLLCMLVHSPTATAIMTPAQQQNLQGTILATLFKAYHQSQAILQNLLARAAQQEAQLHASQCDVDGNPLQPAVHTINIVDKV